MNLALRRVLLIAAWCAITAMAAVAQDPPEPDPALRRRGLDARLAEARAQVGQITELRDRLEQELDRKRADPQRDLSDLEHAVELWWDRPAQQQTAIEGHVGAAEAALARDDLDGAEAELTAAEPGAAALRAWLRSAPRLIAARRTTAARFEAVAPPVQGFDPGDLATRLTTELEAVRADLAAAEAALAAGDATTADTTLQHADAALKTIETAAGTARALIARVNELQPRLVADRAAADGLLEGARRTALIAALDGMVTTLDAVRAATLAGNFANQGEQLDALSTDRETQHAVAVALRTDASAQTRVEASVIALRERVALLPTGTRRAAIDIGLTELDGTLAGLRTATVDGTPDPAARTAATERLAVLTAAVTAFETDHATFAPRIAQLETALDGLDARIAALPDWVEPADSRRLASIARSAVQSTSFAVRDGRDDPAVTLEAAERAVAAIEPDLMPREHRAALHEWADVLEVPPDATAVPDAAHLQAITDSGWPWRVRHRATGIELLLIPGPDGPFYLGRAEVTNAQFRTWAPDHRAGSYSGHDLDGDDQPVGSVSWTKATAFCTAHGLRLPTTAEWKWAARAGVTTRFPWGDDPAGAKERANVQDAASGKAFGWSLPTFPIDDGHRVSSVAGSYPANGLGVFDMLGNVTELDADQWARGASWMPRRFLRDLDSQIEMGTGMTFQDVGFRVARTPRP